MAADLSPDLVTRLARAMTLKYGFVGLPVGGAKVGIVGDPEMPQESKQEAWESSSLLCNPYRHIFC